MKLPIIISVFCLLASCVHIKHNESFEDQQAIYKSWVVSRCLSKALTDDASKQDALNSASAYLEASSLPIEAFTDVESLINEFVTKDYQGSIPGTFNTKKCIDLLNSRELEEVIEKVDFAGQQNQ